MAKSRSAAPKRILVAAAVALVAALACIALLSGEQGAARAARRTELIPFQEFREKCLAACHYNKAHDVKGRLKVMSKCEPGALST